MQWIANEQDKSVPVELIQTVELEKWSASQTARVRQWISQSGFKAKAHSHCLIPTEDGHVERVLVGIKDYEQPWGLGHCAYGLPAGCYHLNTRLTPDHLHTLAISWGLGAYAYTRYKASTETPAQLKLPTKSNASYVRSVVESCHWVRDLINTPASDMTPAHLATAMRTLAERYRAEFSEVVGDALLDQGYSAIHAVGRASSVAPRLLHLIWGDAKHPSVLLVGKGVCFDSGGLDIKSSRGMLLMKKDMGGAAHVLGLAQLIMAQKLSVRLHVLVPAVENVIAGNAFKPGDVIRMRDGQSIEIGNTDAEGRLVLADALLMAKELKPDLIIDMATLTGAARVAVGTDIAAYFCNRTELAQQVDQTAQAYQEAVWRLPLYPGYETYVDSTLADMNNAGKYPYAGATLAALLLQRFVPASIPWLHFDIMAWNLTSRPGRPEGGEAMALRTLFHTLEQYGWNNED